MDETKKYFFKQLLLSIFIHLFATTYIWSGTIAYFIQDGVAKIPYIELHRRMVSTGGYFWMMAVLMAFVFCFEFVKKTPIILLFSILLYLMIFFSVGGIDIPENLTNTTALIFFEVVNKLFILLGYIILIFVAAYKFLRQNELTYLEREYGFYVWILQMFLALNGVSANIMLDFPADIINAIWG